MKKMFKSLIFVPFITLVGCSYVATTSKEGPNPVKEETKTFLHFAMHSSDE